MKEYLCLPTRGRMSVRASFRVGLLLSSASLLPVLSAHAQVVQPTLPVVSGAAQPAPMLPMDARPLPQPAQMLPMDALPLPRTTDQGMTATTPVLNQPAGQVATPNKPPLQGVPFPSLAGQGARTLPLSNERMPLNQERVQRDMGQLQKQTDERMQQLRTGAGLPSPDISADKTELEQLRGIQRNTRLLQSKRQEAEAAMAVYGILYDSRREDDAARREKDGDAPAATTTAPTSGVVSGGTAPTAGTPIAQAPVEVPIPMPQIVSVSGNGSRGGHLNAMLLVPYVGEMLASVGTHLPGGRTVVSVSSEGVRVRDPKFGVVSLGFGDSVAAAPPVAQPAPAAMIGMPPAMIGMPPSLSAARLR